MSTRREGHVEAFGGDTLSVVRRTAFRASLFWRLGLAVRCRRAGNDSLLQTHARRLEHVDDMDADAGYHLARFRGFVSRHVGGDDVAYWEWLRFR
jgi:hypothetical protein